MGAITTSAPLVVRVGVCAPSPGQHCGATGDFSLRIWGFVDHTTPTHGARKCSEAIANGPRRPLELVSRYRIGVGLPNGVKSILGPA